MQNLSDFNPERTIYRAYETIFIGTINGDSAILKLSFPPILGSNIGDITQHKHITHKENGIYSTASADISQHIPYTLIYPATKDDQARVLSQTSYVLSPKVCSGNINLDNSLLPAEFLHGLRKSNSFITEDDNFIFIKSDKAAVSNIMFEVYLKSDKYRDITDISGPELLLSIQKSILAYLCEHKIAPEDVCLYLNVVSDRPLLYITVADLKLNMCIHMKRGWIVILDNAIKNLKLDPSYYKNPIYSVDIN